ncbi:hypothetical protein DMC47_31735 [Nostoc sp. 3335mG]|nr:hypothetical protein DMC47_31735 [Nostoc sp. 3335mG]
MPAPYAETPVLDRRDLDSPRFPSELCDTLFAAVLIDDEIDPNLIAPTSVPLDNDADTLIECFRLCRQLWLDGFQWQELRALAAKLLRDRDLGPADRIRFKHIRAKFKHFRYAHALYGADHRYPRAFDWLTISMGRAQDAYRGGRRQEVLGRTMLMRLLLSEPAAHRVRRESDRLILTTPAAFRTLLRSDYAKLGALLAAPTVTGHGFHAARKVVGRQVSFWDTLRTLEPTEERFRMSRWLSAINGAMGDMHDRLVEDRAADAGSYHAAFVLPGDIRERIATLLALPGVAAKQSGS